MKKIRLHTSAIFLISYLLTACSDQANPLIGHWQQVSPAQEENSIEFTPSTMRINDTRVTVVYQIRKNKVRVRVSASKNEIIYEFIDDDSIQYEDKQHGITKLVRIKP
jgi:uncharacterized protein YcfL